MTVKIAFIAKKWKYTHKHILWWWWGDTGLPHRHFPRLCSDSTKPDASLLVILLTGPRLIDISAWHGLHFSNPALTHRKLKGESVDACRVCYGSSPGLTKFMFSGPCKYMIIVFKLNLKHRTKVIKENKIQNGRIDDLASNIESLVSLDSHEKKLRGPSDYVLKESSFLRPLFQKIQASLCTKFLPKILPSKYRMNDVQYILTRICHHYSFNTCSDSPKKDGFYFPSYFNTNISTSYWTNKFNCQFSRHNPMSLLSSVLDVVGVTAPTLHVGMLFSTVCWYRDPHSLPWIEYLHTGASKIWYGVAASQEEKLHVTLKKLVPDFIKDSAIWLPSDTAMVPPNALVEEGIRVCRVVQEPGQFVVVFPGAFTSSVCTGYLISESAFFARPQYFDRATESFETLHKCCEPSMFSLERLVLSVATDPRAGLDALLRARDLVIEVITKEKRMRATLEEIGLTANERLSTPDSHRKKKSRFIEDEEENMCEICRKNLYVSLVTNSSEEAVYCLEHAIDFLSKNPSQLEFCKLMYTYSLCELDSSLKQCDDKIHQKTTKKSSPNPKKIKPRQYFDSFSSTSSSNM
ncbi:unnamed protein product, partial [Meganyctiphanes norvegica]